MDKSHDCGDLKPHKFICVYMRAHTHTQVWQTSISYDENIPFCFSGADEELGSIAIGSGIGHG